MANLRREEGTPNIVLIGLPDAAALRRAEQKLIAAKIPHFVWEEPDFNFGLTSIATAPVRGDQRKALANYRVYKAPVVSSSTSPSKGESVCSIQTRCANSSGAGTVASAVRV